MEKIINRLKAYYRYPYQLIYDLSKYSKVCKRLALERDITTLTLDAEDCAKQGLEQFDNLKQHLERYKQEYRELENNDHE